ncbi:hypothetical protein K431DRAFT_85373 [Polychaeton citri CBS 116435]|uniref:Secreted protein n=1 Tax=Polychaeton citri CBS 116435 TaxID=1314669 RepID=A0A9P4Q7F8_9PEZI|nr:hypothetical protein K431DRAFT_85373 [Polychaeton citri CBS 116435]
MGLALWLLPPLQPIASGWTRQCDHAEEGPNPPCQHVLWICFLSGKQTTTQTIAGGKFADDNTDIFTALPNGLSSQSFPNIAAHASDSGFDGLFPVRLGHVCPRQQNAHAYQRQHPSRRPDGPWPTSRHHDDTAIAKVASTHEPNKQRCRC